MAEERRAAWREHGPQRTCESGEDGEQVQARVTRSPKGADFRVRRRTETAARREEEIDDGVPTGIRAVKASSAVGLERKKLIARAEKVSARDDVEPSLRHGVTTKGSVDQTEDVGLEKTRTRSRRPELAGSTKERRPEGRVHSVREAGKSLGEADVT